MTSYYSALFFTAFLPITVMLYGMAPRRFRWAVLLLASYGFFFALSGALIAFVALSTAVVYACARMMGANLEEKNRRWLPRWRRSAFRSTFPSPASHCPSGYRFTR